MERDLSIRSLTEATTLKALAHPLRWDLLEALAVHGPLTATEAAELVGESPANCSWHLRQLAKYGLVEEDPSGSGRRRPWRRTGEGMEWHGSEQDPEVEAASQALTDVFLEREFGLIKTAMRRPQPEGWVDHAVATQTITWLTHEELDALGNQLHELLGQYRGRVSDPSLRPPDSRPIRLLTIAAADDRLLPTTGPSGGQHA